jgi:hypothetical protein
LISVASIRRWSNGGGSRGHQHTTWKVLASSRENGEDTRGPRRLQGGSSAAALRARGRLGPRQPVCDRAGREAAQDPAGERRPAGLGTAGPFTTCPARRGL